MVDLNFNGIPLTVHHIPGAKSVAFVVRVEAGFAQEPEGQEGIAHLVEHMVFEGSTNYPRPGELEARTEAAGGYTGASTNPQHTMFFVRVPSPRALKFADRLLDAIFNPTLNDQLISREIEILKREFGLRNESDLLECVKAIYNYLGWGWEKPAGIFTPGDVKQFHRNWYKPYHMNMAIVGNLPREIRKLSPCNFNQVPPTSFKQFTPVNLRLDGGTSDALILLAFPRSPVQSALELAVLNFLNVLVAGRVSAPLVRRCREEGSCYDVSSMIYHHRAGSLFLVAAGVECGIAEPFLENLKQYWVDLQKKGFTKTEFNTALAYYAGTSAMHFEHPRHYGIYLCETMALLGSPITFEEEVRLLKEQGLQKINEVLKTLSLEQSIGVIQTNPNL